MTRQTLLLLFLATTVGSGWEIASTAQAPSALTYDDFAGLSPERRDILYEQLSAEQKSTFLRARFEQWLNDNRKSLSERQVRAVRNAIALVSPEMFRKPPDARTRAQQDAVSSELQCLLGPDLAYSFARGTTPSRIDKSWKQAVQEWYEWVTECVVK